MEQGTCEVSQRARLETVVRTFFQTLEISLSQLAHIQLATMTGSYVSFYVPFSNDYILSTVIILCVGAAVTFLSKLIQARSRFARLSERAMVRDLHRPSFRYTQVDVV